MMYSLTSITFLLIFQFVPFFFLNSLIILIICLCRLPVIDNNRFLSVLTPRLNIDKGYLWFGHVCVRLVWWQMILYPCRGFVEIDWPIIICLYIILAVSLGFCSFTEEMPNSHLIPFVTIATLFPCILWLHSKAQNCSFQHNTAAYMCGTIFCSVVWLLGGYFCLFVLLSLQV